MAVHHSASSLLQAQTERFRRISGSRQEIHRAMMRAAFGDHLALTGGRITSAQLAAMGHPFGRGAHPGSDSQAGRGFRGSKADLASIRSMSSRSWKKGQVSGRGVVSPLPINKQEGRLRSALRVRGPYGAAQSYIIGFDPAKAPYQGQILSPTGTRYMVARGFHQALRKRNAARLHGQLLRARDEQARS